MTKPKHSKPSSQFLLRILPRILKIPFSIKLKGNKITASIFGIVFGMSLGVGYEEYYGIGTWHSFESPSEKFSVCFTPPRGCGSLIAREISLAQESIYMQAYSLSHFAIINQLIDASKRGVKVRVILDSSNFSETRNVVERFRFAGIEVAKDSISGIAHNKIIIIDNQKVITGSFNFSEAADKRNAENAVLINDPLIAKEFIANWMSRYEERSEY